MDFSNLTEAQLEEITAPGPGTRGGEAGEPREVWLRFGDIMTAAHDSVYEEKPVRIRKPFPFRRLWQVGVPLAVALLLTAAVLFQDSNRVKIGNPVPDEKLEWDALDADFERMNTQLDNISREESPVDTEIATLFDSLESYDSTSGEDWF